ncbi:hypothetical protein CTAYLR_008411 [Chrysophaeum taylorii]|uniref:Thioredoxin domain-containing protein n=1 Tax=Chrysophaeum taylorii TaxID=2483200 RepID=A0AAD7UKQ7_9STRA|nr:hypothetical protein CTAYLR_008411 [Chrysophaeum taylorii]
MWWWWCQAYYLVNIAILGSWAYLRTVVPGNIREVREGHWFQTQEREVFLLVGFGLLAKARRASSLHEYAYKIFLYGKVAIGLCLARCGNYALLALYAAVLAATFVFLPTPSFPGHQYVDTFDAARFAEHVLRIPNDQKSAPLWLVMFSADWCETCALAQPLFCSLAAEHTSRRRKFALIDVSKNPTIARRFNIDVSHKTLQLPTFALFFAGREKLRLPYFDEANRVVKTKFARSALQSFFLLDTPVKDAVATIKRRDAQKAQANADTYVDAKLAAAASSSSSSKSE